MPATMKIISRMTGKLSSVFVYSVSGDVMPIRTACIASSPPGCSG